MQPRQLPTAWVGALARWIKRIEAAPRSPRRPLIVQGEEDMTVDWQHNLQVLRGKFDQPEVLMLKRGRHHLANEIPEIRNEYFKYPHRPPEITQSKCGRGLAPMAAVQSIHTLTDPPPSGASPSHILLLRQA